MVEELLTRCELPARGDALVCGVSGGADSLALLALAVAAGCVVTAVHVDHGLREGSGGEAALVARVATQLGAGFRAEQVGVTSGPGLEARARAARHAVLGADAALAHTADDLAETMLLNLVRGSGLDGLTRLRPGRRHPILRLRRTETEAVCASIGVEPFLDPSNLDPAFARNRVRREVLPLLVDVAGGRDVVALLARTSDLLAADADALDILAAAAVPDVCDARTMAGAPPALAARAVREWLAAAGPGGSEHHPPSAAAVARVLAVARLEVGACELAGGWRVARTAGRLRLVEPSN